MANKNKKKITVKREMANNLNKLTRINMRKSLKSLGLDYKYRA